MINKIREKQYLLGYPIIFYGIIRFVHFVYICFYFGNDILNNQERTIINSNSVITISKSHFEYINIILIILFYLVYSIVIVLLGIHVIKKGSMKRLNNAIR